MKTLILHVMVLSAFVEGQEVGPVSVGRVVVVLAVLVATLEVLSTRRMPVPHPAVLVPVGVLTAWTLLSSMWATDQLAWREGVLQLALALGYFYAYVALIESRRQVHNLLKTYVIGATGSALYGLAQIGQETRAVGLQGDPNTFALYSLAALPIALVLVSEARGGTRVLWVMAATLQFTAIFGSQSRGALLGLVALIIWLVLAEGSGNTGPTKSVRVMSGVAISTVLAIIISMFPRLQPSQVLEDRGTGRLDIWLTAWNAWLEQPLLGLGAGNFEARSGELLSHQPGVQLSPLSDYFEGIRIHNAYLDPLVELGPVGLVGFVSLLVGTGLILQRDRRRHGAGPIGALLPVLVTLSVTTIFLSVMNNKLLWMLVSIAAVLAQLPSRADVTDARSSVEPPVGPPAGPTERRAGQPVGVTHSP